MLLASAFAIGAQETLTVYEGQGNSSEVPVYGLWADAYTKCEIVMDAAELGDMPSGSTITGLKWYLSNPASANWGNAKFKIFMMEVESNTISEYYGMDDATLVYDGSLDPTAAEMAIEFSTTYTYNGGNLLIGVYQYEKGTFKGASFSGVNVTGGSIGGYSNSSLDEVPATARNFIPKTTFTYMSGEPEENAAQVNVTSLAFGKTTKDSEKVMNVVLKNKGSNPFTPAISGLEAPFSTTYEAAELAYRESATIPVKFAPTEYGEYTGTMTINCGEAGTFTVALSGNCPNEFEVTVSDGENQSEFAPIYGYNCDHQGAYVQMLYPAEMLNAAVGAKIIGVKFYPAGAISVGTPNIELSLKGTEETAFEAESSIATPSNIVTDLTTVASITLANGQTELEFDFDQPYTYEGGNLAVQTLVTVKGTWAHTYFYGVNQEGNTAYAEWGGSGYNKMVQFLPKMTLICTTEEQPQPEKAYYLIGDFNEWNQEEMVPFVEEDGVFTLTKTFSGQFKIKDEQGKWWGGGATLTAENPSVELDDTDGSDTNLVLAEEAEYTLTIEDGVLTVTGFPEPVIPEYSEFYVVGDFNEWNQTEDGGRVELVGNEEGTEYTGSVEMQAEQKFKVITPNPNPTSDDDQWIWFGGADENEMGYFLINNDMLNVDISLIDGANFQVQAGGEYTITVKAAQADGTRAVQEPLVMVVTMKPTAITTISSDMNNDNAWYGINGIRYENRPTAKGVYIHNGKKVVIK